MSSPHDFYLEVIGKKYDEDGVYGCQCVDGFKTFCRLIYNLKLGSICYPTGYATSIWDNFEELGLNEYFDKVESNFQDGDWCIWDMHSKSCPYSHVAMFRKDNGNSTGVFLGQNQNNHPEFTQVNIYYDGIRGALRPKIYVHEQEYSIGNYKTLGNMYVRSNPGLIYRVKLVKELTEDGKKHALDKNPNAYAVYEKGTIFTAKEIINNNFGTWAKTPSGYVCIKGASGTIYCERV